MKIRSPTINAHMHVIKFLQNNDLSQFTGNDNEQVTFTKERDSMNRLFSTCKKRNKAISKSGNASALLHKLRSDMAKPNINLAVDISSEINQIGSINIDNSKLFKSSRNNNITYSNSTHTRSGLFNVTRLRSLNRNHTSKALEKLHPAFNSNSYRFKDNYRPDVPPIGNYSPQIVTQNPPLYSFGKAQRPHFAPKNITPYQADLDPRIPLKHILIPDIQKSIPRNKADLLMKEDKIIKSSPFDYTTELKRLQEMVDKYSPNYDEIKLLNVRAKQVHSIFMKVNAAPRIPKHDM